jgi:hypothetical protein
MMKEGRDYTLIFNRLKSDFSDNELMDIAQTGGDCQAIDPNIQEMVKYLECINQPAPGIYSGI